MDEQTGYFSLDFQSRRQSEMVENIPRTCSAQDAVSVKQSVLLRKFEQQVEADEGFTSGLTSMMERLKLSE